MLVVDPAAPRHRGSQQLLRQQYLRAHTVGTAVGTADTVESIARCNHPRILRGSLEVFAEVLKDGRMLWWCERKIIQRLVNTRGQRRRRKIMPPDSVVDDLRKKRAVRHQL